MSFLFTNWKAIAIGLAVAAVFYAGMRMQGALDRVEADKLIAEQVEANKAAQDAMNTKAAKVEADLAAERQKSSDLQKRWSKLNAKPHAVCTLPADTILLLKDATANDRNPG